MTSTIETIFEATLLKQGYRSYKLRKTFSKIYHRHSELIIKYEGCSKNNVTCIGAHIAEVLLFILICSALQNTLRQPEHTF